MVGASESAQATGELTQAGHVVAASGALTGRDALLANLGSDLVSAGIKTLNAQRQQPLAEKKAVARALKMRNARGIAWHEKPITSARMTSSSL